MSTQYLTILFPTLPFLIAFGVFVLENLLDLLFLATFQVGFAIGGEVGGNKGLEGEETELTELVLTLNVEGALIGLEVLLDFLVLRDGAADGNTEGAPNCVGENDRVGIVVGLSEGYEPQPNSTFDDFDFDFDFFPFLDGAADGNDDGLQLGNELGLIDNEGMIEG